ncbi:hypothetical protein CHU98_g2343 [Xylaria longipes]|nr:hypothetical protein CHU98_g2343 [Xylaria longipes]
MILAGRARILTYLLITPGHSRSVRVGSTQGDTPISVGATGQTRTETLTTVHKRHGADGTPSSQVANTLGRVVEVLFRVRYAIPTLPLESLVPVELRVGSLASSVPGLEPGGLSPKGMLEIVECVQHNTGKPFETLKDRTISTVMKKIWFEAIEAYEAQQRVRQTPQRVSSSSQHSADRAYDDRSCVSTILSSLKRACRPTVVRTLSGSMAADRWDTPSP